MKTTQKPARLHAAKHTVSYQLRELIEARGLTAHAVGIMSEVDPGVVRRFMRGQRDLRLETVDRVAGALGLRLVEVGRKGRGTASTMRPAESRGRAACESAATAGPCQTDETDFPESPVLSDLTGEEMMPPPG